VAWGNLRCVSLGNPRARQICADEHDQGDDENETDQGSQGLLAKWQRPSGSGDFRIVKHVSYPLPQAKAIKADAIVPRKISITIAFSVLASIHVSQLTSAEFGLSSTLMDNIY
jgi:hypothetical protein